jgi:hypothetical protein
MWNYQGQQGQPATGQTIVMETAIIDGTALDNTEPLFLRAGAILLLVRSFVWSMIGFSGSWYNVFIPLDKAAPWFAGGWINSPGLFWSGYMIHIHILAIVAGLVVQGICTYVQYLYRHRKEAWPYRLALLFDVMPDFWATWTFLGMLLISYFLGVLSFWAIMPIVVVVLFLPTFLGAVVPEQILVKN